MPISLHEIGLKYLTDKATYHKYTPVYESILKSLRAKKISFLELGWGGPSDISPTSNGGASARMWREYGRYWDITVIDINDKETEPGINFRQGDQSDPDFLNRLAVEFGPWDVIVDDASHVNALTIASIQHLWQHLKPGGWYFIEDLATTYLPEYGGIPEPGAEGTALAYLKRLTDDVMRGSEDVGWRFPAHLGEIEEIRWTQNLCAIHKAS